MPYNREIQEADAGHPPAGETPVTGKICTMEGFASNSKSIPPTQNTGSERQMCRSRVKKWSNREPGY